MTRPVVTGFLSRAHVAMPLRQGLAAGLQIDAAGTTAQLGPRLRLLSTPDDNLEALVSAWDEVDPKLRRVRQCEIDVFRRPE